MSGIKRAGVRGDDVVVCVRLDAQNTKKKDKIADWWNCSREEVIAGLLAEVLAVPETFAGDGTVIH